jgi:hypothetical protein
VELLSLVEWRLVALGHGHLDGQRDLVSAGLGRRSAGI